MKKLLIIIVCMGMATIRARKIKITIFNVIKKNSLVVLKRTTTNNKEQQSPEPRVLYHLLAYKTYIKVWGEST